MSNLRVASGLKLAEAPKQYDKSDQDRTRRLIEMALAAYSRQIQNVADEIGVEATEAGNRYDPVSPIHGTVHTASTAASPPYIQLLNPPGSGKIIVLYELRLMHGTNTRVLGRVTQTPVDLAGVAAVITSAFLEHRDETDITVIKGTLKGTTIIVGTPFIVGAANWADILETDSTTQAKWLFGRGAASLGPVVGATSYGNHQPIILQPGDAVEFVSTTNNTTLRCYACWDEFALTDIVGITDLNDPSAPKSSCWGMGIGQVGAVNGGSVIQFYNPGPKIAKITQLDVLASTSSYAQLYRTSVPSTLGPGGTQTTYLVTRMARRDQLGVQCKIYGYNFATFYGGNRLMWRDKGHYAQGIPYEQIVGPYGAPLYVLPGESVELVNETFNNIPISMRVFWDEITSIPS